MVKCLAGLADLQSEPFRARMEEINSLARRGSLQEYATYCRIWEYPWVTFQLQQLKGRGLRLLDVGSEISPLPWFLASQGFDVTVSDFTASYWRRWQRATQQLEILAQRRILDCQELDLPTASVDIYLSASVIEHVPFKQNAIAEAARVLRPGGILLMTFDICEPEMGMTFPAWNGRALSMREFDQLFGHSTWFDPELSRLSWNTDVIPEYLAWHRTTAPHHNYVTGGVLVRRNQRTWEEPRWNSFLRIVRGETRTTQSLVGWYVRNGPIALRNRIARRLKSFAVRAG